MRYRCWGRPGEAAGSSVEKSAARWRIVERVLSATHAILQGHRKTIRRPPFSRSRLTLTTSSFRSHSGSCWKVACSTDYALNGQFLAPVEDGKRAMDACGPVAVTMEVAGRLRANREEILEYANSGDTTWNKSRAVGCAAAPFHKNAILRCPPLSVRQKSD